ncbi:MAG: hypothetical protein H6740_24255 [Alphaproteobacteria bacterium]|nr:hypothetical protein [Alphaproteobacteria bacterium]
MRTALALLFLPLLACEQGEPEAPPPPEDPCPEVGLETLAGDWIRVSGSKGDHTQRVRVLEGLNEAWYVGGGFTKKRMTAEKRPNDLMMTEQVSGAREEAFKAGTDSIERLYFRPNKKKCAMQAVHVRVEMVDGKEKETQTHSGFLEYLPFPQSGGFSFRPCDEPVYIGKAAESWAEAKRQIDAQKLDVSETLGEQVPAGAWSDPAQDGPESCSYTADLYFDDQPVEGKQGVAASLESGRRKWFDRWYAPYSGNHHFEIYRYRECEGLERELIAVACLEGILE